MPRGDFASEYETLRQSHSGTGTRGAGVVFRSRLMLRPLFFRALNSLPMAGFRRSAQQFRAALDNPEEVQRRLLLDLLKQNRECAHGRQHGFASISTIHEYQGRVPVVTYDELAPSIERIKS